MSSIVLVPPSPSFRTISNARGNISFTWTGQVGFNYQVQYKTNLTSITWSNLGSPILATNTVMSGSDSISVGSTTKFYRIALLP